MSQEQDIYLPVATNFGAKREDIWRAYEDEKAVKAAWALTLLSEYRLIQLKRYGVIAKRVDLKPIEFDVKSTIDDELLVDLLLLFAWVTWQLEATRSMIEKLRQMKSSNSEKIYKQIEKLQQSLEVMKNLQYKLYYMIWDYINSSGKKYYYNYMDYNNIFQHMKNEDNNIRKYLDPLSGYKPKNWDNETKQKELSKLIEKFVKLDGVSKSEWREFFINNDFDSLMELADKLDQLLGRKSKIIQIPIYRVEAVGDIEIPSYEEIEKEADELLKKLAHLGGKLEYVLSSLVVNGYRKGVTNGIEGLDESEKTYLEELLDTPFKRVALIIAYGRIRSLKKIIQRLNRESFICRTSVPIAYLESRVDVRRILG
ncbi:MAG: hypothetical protein QXH21_09875 [Ignisphaera sp.]